MGTLMVLSAFAIIVRPQGRRTPHNDSDLLLALDVTVEQASNQRKVNALQKTSPCVASSIISGLAI